MSTVEELVPLGLGGVEAPMGSHICAFFHGRSGRDELLVPFLAAGIHSGEKCLAIVDTSTPEHVWACLEATEDVKELKRNGQLEVLSADETYLREGRFDIDRMIDFWTESVAAQAGRFERIRASGEAEWAMRGLPGTETFFYYESRINQFSLQFPNVFLLCLYDLDTVSGRWVIDAMKTHPHVLIGGRLFENPYYMDPDSFAREGAALGTDVVCSQAFPPL